MVCLTDTDVESLPSSKSAPLQNGDHSQEHTPATNHIKEQIIDSNPRILLSAHQLIVIVSSLLLHCLLLAKPDYLVLDEHHYLGLLKMFLRGEHHLGANPPGQVYLMRVLSWVLSLDRVLLEGDEGRQLLALYYFRLGTALCGSLIPIICFNLLRKLKVSPIVSSFGALLLLSNTALVTDSRFVSPYPLMMITSLLALYHVTAITHEQSPTLYRYLCIGVLLGVSLTVVHVGIINFLFLSGFVLLSEWQRFGDIEKCEKELWIRFGKIVGLVFFAPVVIYLAAWWFMVVTCTTSGTTDGHHSIAFQVNLLIFTITIIVWPSV